MKKYHVICEDHDTRFMGELDYGDYDSSEHAIECLESYRDGTDLGSGLITSSRW